MVHDYKQNGEHDHKPRIRRTGGKLSFVGIPGDKIGSKISLPVASTSASTSAAPSQQIIKSGRFQETGDIRLCTTDEIKLRLAKWMRPTCDRGHAKVAELVKVGLMVIRITLTRKVKA